MKEHIVDHIYTTEQNRSCCVGGDTCTLAIAWRGTKTLTIGRCGAKTLAIGRSRAYTLLIGGHAYTLWATAVEGATAVSPSSSPHQTIC
jgi:hypothetical protein